MIHRSLTLTLLAGTLAWPASGAWGQETRPEKPPPPRTVKAFVQTRPGRPRAEAEMRVFPAPVDLPVVEAGNAHLDDQDLVLGVTVDGAAMAYPVRFLAMFEVVNARVGETPLAPTW